MSTDITPERIAEHLHGSEVFENRALAGYVDVASEGNVLRIGFTPKGKPGEVQQFRAPVVPGTDIPIVLPRPDLADGLAFEGGAFDDDDAEGWQVVTYSSTRKWPCLTKDADSILFRGAPGVISPAEARRFAAALVAVADAVDAAQAEQDGGR